MLDQEIGDCIICFAEIDPLKSFYKLSVSRTYCFEYCNIEYAFWKAK